MDGEVKKGGNGVMWAVVVVVLALIAYGGYKYMKKDVSTEALTTSEPIVTFEPTAYTFKDGTYQTIGNYNSPGGAEEIDVSLTIADGLITDATVVSKATRPRSVTMQGQFVSGFKEQVIGKSLNDVYLDKVSGSSLTPKGFNEAVEEIKEQAKV